jgi:hypothetical protein
MVFIVGYTLVVIDMIIAIIDIQILRHMATFLFACHILFTEDKAAASGRRRR